jgi:hypothetical protein
MSQERTRFPIQPKDVRRSATSHRDATVAGAGGSAGAGARHASPDKPAVPPHRRERAKDESAVGETSADEALADEGTDG